MKSDIFGNLMDWGKVLENLERLRDSKTMDQHQPGLARILRYPDNWRLREATLRIIRDLERPTDELLEETLSIALNENAYLEVRRTAIDVLGDLMIKGRKIRSKHEMAARSRMMQEVESLLEDTRSPLLKEEVVSFFKKLADRRRVAGSRA